ncbi:GNAT family N-acetyltransferase [Membranihabitans marinus]|uniref:GNAT family N-acetyltransferase n=1 Tax=Membranihabitans marinus TaxID=1227546 RepID=UPI001F196719|nr:GNAT family N-acetyltransferase [Membranihabitans marinus]
MAIRVQSFTASEAQPYIQDLAKLRIEVFREFPYLYDGSLDSESEYLEAFLNAKQAIIVVAFDDDQVIGVSTGLPLKYEPDNVKAPWINSEPPIDEIFYFSESVLQKKYRGQGIGLKFFEERESWARKLLYNFAVFCAVLRPNNHLLTPSGYTKLDQFWKNRGYQKKNNFICTMVWKDITEKSESKKELQFWYKRLNDLTSNIIKA